MIIDLIIYFAIFTALCAAAPVCLILLYAVLQLFPKTRRMMDDSRGTQAPAA